MKKYYIKNKYTYFAIAIGVILLISSCLLRYYEIGFFDLIFNFDVYAPDLSGNGAIIRKEYINSYIKDVDMNMTVMLYYFTEFACIIPLIATLFLHDEIHSRFINFSFTRNNSNKIIFSKFSKVIVIASIIAVIPLALIMLIVFFISDSNMTTNTSALSLFSDILGFNLADINICLYYLAYLLVYFIFCIAYSTFSVGISTIVDKKFLVILLGYAYYNAMSYYIPNLLSQLFNTPNIIDYLGSYNTITSFGITDMPTYLIFTPLIIPFFIGIILIYVFSKRIKI